MMMDEFNPIEIISVMGILITGFSALGVALISRWKSDDDTGAVNAGTLSSLVKSVETMNNTLAKERAERLQDGVRFEKELEELRSFYRKKASEIESASTDAIQKLREQNTREMDSMRAFYEARISRLEQGHRDRVEALKGRIRALEMDRRGR